MSVVHAVAQATLAPSPSASPVVEAVKTAVVTHAAAPSTQGLTQWLNTVAALLQPYIVVIAAALASALQVLLNKLKWLQSDVAKLQALYRRLLAAALPFLGAYIASVASGQNVMHVAPYIFVASQILYSAVQALKAVGAASASANQDVVLASDEAAG